VGGWQQANLTAPAGRRQHTRLSINDGVIDIAPLLAAINDPGRLGRESQGPWERMCAEWCAVHETPEAVAAMSQID